MIAHQNVRMNPPSGSPAAFPERLQKPIPIRTVTEYRFLPISAAHHMICRPFIFNPRFPWHSNKVIIGHGRVNTKIRGLTLFADGKCGECASRTFRAVGHASVRRKGSTSHNGIHYAMLIRCRCGGAIAQLHRHCGALPHGSAAGHGDGADARSINTVRLADKRSPYWWSDQRERLPPEAFRIGALA